MARAFLAFLAHDIAAHPERLTPLTDEASEGPWTVYLHPLFRTQLESLRMQVETLKRQDPARYRRRHAAKRLAALARLAFEVIPRDPTNAAYRQDEASGDPCEHWFQAELLQQYRLFFRCQAASRTIVIAWVSDTKISRRQGWLDPLLACA